MKTVVISLGGSLIVPSEIDIPFLRGFRELIIRKVSEGYSFALICGGGKICRTYQHSAKQISKVFHVDLDWIGIASTRLNAELVRAVFGSYAYEKVVTNPHDTVKTKKKIIVGSGHVPGCSTDKDAVLIAKNIKAETIINLSNIEYVYDKDPRKYNKAKPLARISWKEYKQIVGRKWTPGLNAPFDPVAAKEAEKCNMRVVIMQGSDLKNLENYLDGKRFKGTIIE